MVSTVLVAGDRPVELPAAIADAAGLRPGDTLIVETTEPGRIEMRVVPRLSLEEFISRFRVDLVYDDATIREEWQDEAAREIIGR